MLDSRGVLLEQSHSSGCEDQRLEVSLSKSQWPRKRRRLRNTRVKIVPGYPPNYEVIKQYLNPPLQAVFPYGDKIFNPSGQEIPEDILFHESIHRKQQESFGTADLWWDKYLIDRKYRLMCEVEAYGEQLKWLKGHGLNAKGQKEALEEFATMIELYYNTGKPYFKILTLIRKYAQE